MKMRIFPVLGNLPGVAVGFNGESFNFLLDTGAAEVLLSLSTAQKLIGSKPAAAEPVTVHTNFGVAGGWRTPYDFQFAGNTINSVVIADLPPGVDGVLGVHILQTFKAVVIDFPNSTIEFDASGQEAEMAVSDKRHTCGALMLYCAACKDDFCISQMPAYCPQCGRKVSGDSIAKLKQGFEQPYEL